MLIRNAEKNHLVVFHAESVILSSEIVGALRAMLQWLQLQDRFRTLFYIEFVARNPFRTNTELNLLQNRCTILDCLLMLSSCDRAVSWLFSPPWPKSPAVWCTRIASNMYMSIYWFQPCLALIQIMLVKLQCIISSIIVATEHFHIGLKTVWQYFKNYSDNINSGPTSVWSLYCYEMKLYSTCLYDQWSL